MYVCIFIYTYIYLYVYLFVYIYIYIYILRAFFLAAEKIFEGMFDVFTFSIKLLWAEAVMI